jgi:hypothetical protein
MMSTVTLDAMDLCLQRPSDTRTELRADAVDEITDP